MNSLPIFSSRWLLAIGFLLVATVSLVTVSAETDPAETTRQSPSGGSLLETGISVAQFNPSGVQALGHNWMKTYDPPAADQGVNVLYRYDINAFFSPWSQGWHLGREVALYGEFIDAYEIGNEPNLSSEWGQGPDAVTYARHLCSAYQTIKSSDPTALVISAGLAPVGRIDSIWNGKLGHDGTRQDEREWITEFIIAGGHNCADAIGFHPMGYRADFDAEPDAETGVPGSDCSNGLCFRTVEKVREKLVERGIDMPIWATEVGWLVEPPEACLDHPSWDGRAWQIVTEAERDANIQGAIDYAADNYPWMDTLIVWNLNFANAPWYDLCEQMRFYSQEMPTQLPFEKLFVPIVTNRR